jgi:cobalt/nickel transport system permease protein
MINRLLLAFYIAALILITSIHHLGFLLSCQAVVILLSARTFPKIAKKAFLAVLLFNSIVTISYTILTTIKGNFSSAYVLLINIRVFLLTTLTFYISGRINLFKALDFSRSLSYLLVLAYSQTLTLRRLFDEFRMALKSRSLTRPGLKNLYRHGASTGAYFTHKALHDAGEITQAMKSRGFFND